MGLWVLILGADLKEGVYLLNETQSADKGCVKYYGGFC